MLCENLINKPIKLIKCNSNYLLGTLRNFEFQIIADLIILCPAISSECSQCVLSKFNEDPLKRKVESIRNGIKVIVCAAKKTKK